MGKRILCLGSVLRPFDHGDEERVWQKRRKSVRKVRTGSCAQRVHELRFGHSQRPHVHLSKSGTADNAVVRFLHHQTTASRHAQITRRVHDRQGWEGSELFGEHKDHSSVLAHHVLATHESSLHTVKTSLDTSPSNHRQSKFYTT